MVKKYCVIQEHQIPLLQISSFNTYTGLLREVDTRPVIDLYTFLRTNNATVYITGSVVRNALNSPNNVRKYNDIDIFALTENKKELEQLQGKLDDSIGSFHSILKSVGTEFNVAKDSNRKGTFAERYFLKPYVKDAMDIDLSTATKNGFRKANTELAQVAEVYTGGSGSGYL